MPFHSHSHHQSSSNPSTNNTNPPTQPGAVAGLFQAAQALGSIGAPTGNLRTATAGTTTAGTDVLLSGQQSAPQHSQHSQHSQSSLAMPTTPSSASSQYQQFDARRAQMARLPEDIQMPSSQPAHLPSQTQQQQQQLYSSTPTDYSQSAQQMNMYSSMSSGVPGSLQPASGRPPPQSVYTAPSTVPTVPHINTNAQQYTLPTRSNTMNTSHSHSRSSPAGLEQKYVPFGANPDPQKYSSQTPSQKLFSSQTPNSAVSHSPLALDQIRPRANSNMGDEVMTGTAMFGDQVDNKQPTNSNYLAPWAVFAFDWCKYPVPQGNSAGKIAVGSYLEDPHNFIQILDTTITPQEVTMPGAPPFGLEYTRIAEATCSYPVTRILWEPPISQKQSTDLLATSGDHLRLWSLPSTPPSANISSTITRSSSVNTREPAPQKLTPLALLSNSKTPEHTAPLTSLDWNTLSPKLIITSSIDTTCTIWDIPTLTAKTQLIAHDKEVFDVRFCAGSVDVFVSCGADGSVRMFDLRSLEHSTIIYEPSDKQPGDKDKGTPDRMSPTRAQQTLTYAPPLLRLAASPHDSHLLATFAADSNIIRILDVRQPGQALLELRGHAAPITAVEWAPNRRGMLASGADDSLVLVWDLLNSHNGAVLNGDAAIPAPVSGNAATPSGGQQQGGAAGAPGTSTQGQGVSLKGPAASWRCEYEVANLSWAPQSALTAQGGEWVGVAGGRGVWGVKL
ncbi:WD40 repeat-like protein [Trichodelitschia bisporula]|uniref:WD40 repeat-like protein n=1 Tax=Trichodelitschia bisporula TaxID=703511 RepID=A0A6G1I312_9PEZI|nr:WD40 repeat-like protein [Trichodelitschia bisporula]